jgi:hypothetical protein
MHKQIIIFLYTLINLLSLHIFALNNLRRISDLQSDSQNYTTYLTVSGELSAPISETSVSSFNLLIYNNGILYKNIEQAILDCSPNTVGYVELINVIDGIIYTTSSSPSIGFDLSVELDPSDNINSTLLNLIERTSKCVNDDTFYEKIIAPQYEAPLFNFNVVFESEYSLNTVLSPRGQLVFYFMGDWGKGRLKLYII